MTIPKNPDTIIIKNKMYPEGLTEGQIWNYYQKYKGIVLNNTRGRDLMFAIMVDINKPILKRRSSEGFIQLTNVNYDQIINGRTTAIYSTMKAYEDFCIIDIDTDDWNKAIQTTLYMYDIVHKTPMFYNYKILYTGKNSFHIYCYLRNKLPINHIKNLLLEYIQQNNNPQLFTIQQKRTSTKPNIDLSPNKFKGAYITEGSISIWGLKCVSVSLKNLKSFKQWNSKI